MKIFINPNQLLLLTNLHVIEGRGIVQNGKNLITESRLKEYLVAIWIDGFYAQIRVGAQSKGTALMIVKRLFPKARTKGSAISV